jgi:hypothetical protein
MANCMVSLKLERVNWNTYLIRIRTKLEIDVLGEGGNENEMVYALYYAIKYG